MGQGTSKPTKLDLWLAKYKEDALYPEQEIVDPHHHLFDALNEPRGDISLAAKVVRRLPYGMRMRLVRLLLPKAGIDTFGVHSPVMDVFLSDELVEGFGGHNVQQSVVVEAQYEDKKTGKPELYQVSESKLYYEASQNHDGGFPHALVAFIDLNLPADRVAAAIVKHKEANPNLVGLRHQLAWHKDKAFFSARHAHENMSRSKAFRASMARVAEAGLSFDIYCFHTQLAEAAELAEAFPGMQFILDHVGQPLGIGKYAGKAGREQAFKEWQEGIKLCAAQPNVVVKVSGLLMPICGFGFEKRPSPPTSDELLEVTFPYYQFVLESFGEDRCMFASNFPVDRVSCSYAVLYNSFKKFCDRAELSQETRDKLFKANAQRVYKLAE